jgi:hypothetical protein
MKKNLHLVPHRQRQQRQPACLLAALHSGGACRPCGHTHDEMEGRRDGGGREAVWRSVTAAANGDG